MKKAIFGLIVGTALLISSVVFAAPATTQEDNKKTVVRHHEGFNVFKAFRKGGRGLINIGMCPLEIPNQMVREAKRHKTVGGEISGYLSGVPIGCGWMLYRCGTGIFDVVTGPVPLPTYEKSYIHPEFMFPEDPYAEAEE